MVPELTLIVSDLSDAADHLCAVLISEGLAVRQVTPDYVLVEWCVEHGAPDMLLVDASLEVDVVRRMARRIARGTNRPPTTVIFAAADFEDITPHVRAGLDYIVPPFHAALVRCRLDHCHTNQVFVRTTAELETAANLFKYERELQIGREIQAGFLPESLPRRAGWQINARFQPAREVAGDFYDAFELLGGTRIGLIVADVCDKGIGAALFMALIRTLLRHSVTHVDPPSGRWVIGPHGTLEPGSGVDAALLLRAVAATNDYLISNHLRQGYFASLFFAVLNPDTGGIVYANCGHNPPILRRGDGGHSLLEPTGPALGLLPESIFTYGRATLDPGDLLFIYTDGVPDARDAAGEFFTEERMLRLVTTTVGADALLTRIDGEISGHVGTAEPFDDITMIALYRQPDPSESTSPEQPAALQWFDGVPSY